MTDNVPESIRRCVRGYHDDLEYILKHGSSLELHVYAEAASIKRLFEPKVNQVIDELDRGQEALQLWQLLLSLAEPLGVLGGFRPPFERLNGRFVHLPYLQRLHLLRRRMYKPYHLVRVCPECRNVEYVRHCQPSQEVAP